MTRHERLRREAEYLTRRSADIWQKDQKTEFDWVELKEIRMWFHLTYGGNPEQAVNPGGHVHRRSQGGRMTQQSPVKPALDALAVLRGDVLERIGKDGGNLNGKLRANFAVIEATLRQFDTIDGMNRTISQQSQLVAKIMNDLSRLALPSADVNGGDDGSSATKGE